MIDSPVYISGHYRSGTTLISNILDQNPDLKITYGTIHYLRSYGKYEPISERYGELIKDTCERLRKKWQLEAQELEMIQEVEKSTNITNAVVYDALMRVFLETSQNERWGEKTNVQWEGMLPFLDMFLNGRCIHIIRDPRAVLASFKHFTFQPTPRYLDSNFAAMAMFDFVARDEIKSDPRILLLKYEDLILNPEKVIRNICDHLQVTFHEKMLDMTGQANAPYEANSSFHDAKKTIDSASLDLWKNKLSKADIAFTEGLLGERMSKWGYEKTNPTLSEDDRNELDGFRNHSYIKQRLEYVASHGTGQQAFPDDENAYQLK